MKIILFFTVLLFTACGTDQGEAKTYIYTVRNESGVSIMFKGYKTNSNAAPTIIELENNQELTKIFKDGLPPRGPYGFSDFFQSDSLVVLLNNNKKIIYLWEPRCENGNDRNPLNSCFHSRGEEEAFIFSVEDYENAEDCNGNCD